VALSDAALVLAGRVAAARGGGADAAALAGGSGTGRGLLLELHDLSGCVQVCTPRTRLPAFARRSGRDPGRVTAEAGARRASRLRPGRGRVLVCSCSPADLFAVWQGTGVRLGLSAAVGACDGAADFLSVKTGAGGAGGAGDSAGGAGGVSAGGRAPFLALEWSVDTRAGRSAGPLAGGEALALLEGRGGGWWRALGARAAARVRVGGAEVAGNAAGVLPLLSQLARAGCVPPPPLRTKWTRRVPHPVLIGHAASLTSY